MKRKDIKIKSECDNLELSVTMFIPDEEVIGIVQFSHGMVEHKIYYFEFMKYLTKLGYVTIINDHRGHGKSVKEKEDLGYFYEESSDYIVDDLHQVTKYVKKEYPNKKVILFGHSMGSLIVRKYIKKYDNEIEKLIVCGSPSINHLSSMGVLLSKTIKLFKGDKYRSKFLNTLALSKKATKDWLSYDLDYINNYRKDPLCNYIFTTNGFINLTRLMVDTYSKKDWKLYNKDLKIFFIAGYDDIVIKNEKLWLKSISFLRKIGYENISYKMYPNKKHALILEKEKEEVYEDIVNFIKKG